MAEPAHYPSTAWPDTDRASGRGSKRRVLAALLLATFVVALAYGIVLPLLPLLAERTFGVSSETGLHVGLVTGAYAFGLFLFAPLWGRWSDRWGRRRILLSGLWGFALSLALMAAAAAPFLLYLGRFLSGGFAAAVLPVSQALTADLTSDEESRGVQFGKLGIAAAAGLLGGPPIGGILGGGFGDPAAALAAPLAILAVAAAGVAMLAAVWLPSVPARTQPRPFRPGPTRDMPILLLIGAVAAGTVGAFEVAVTLQAYSLLDLTSAQIGLVFAECMLVMAAAQAIVFNPWVRLRRTHLVIIASLVLLGLALFLLGSVRGAAGLTIVTGGFAAAAGIIVPALALGITLTGERLPGLQLGKQVAVASLGQAVGSAIPAVAASRGAFGLALEVSGLAAVGVALVAFCLWRRAGASMR